MEIVNDTYYKRTGKNAPLIDGHIVKIKSVTIDKDGEPYIYTYKHGYYTGPYFKENYEKVEAPEEEVPKLSHIRSLYCVDCGVDADLSEYRTDCGEVLTYCDQCTEQYMEEEEMRYAQN